MTQNSCSGSCLCQAVGYEIRPPYAFFLVPAGTLDGDPGASLERNIHWDSRACRYERVDDLPFYAEGPK